MFLTQQRPGWGSKFQLWKIRRSTLYLYKVFVKLEYKFSTSTPAAFNDNLGEILAHFSVFFNYSCRAFMYLLFWIFNSCFG